MTDSDRSSDRSIGPRRRWWWPGWLAVLLLSGSVACLVWWAVAAWTPTPRYNVVWVVIDAAGARHLGCYGNERDTTPHIDAFARDATLFERAYAQAAWTLPSVCSYLKGKYPPPGGSSQAAKAVAGVSVPAILRNAGMQTAGFSENPYVTHDFGIGAGFDVFEEYFPFEELKKTRRRFGQRNSDKTLDDVVDWLGRQGQDLFFLYVHLLPPHAPYDPPAPFKDKFDPDYAGSIEGTVRTLADINKRKITITERDLRHLRAQYHENLAYADHQVGRLIDELRALGLLDETLVIVSADHGEAFCEHGRLLHNWTVYEEMIHVPLLIRFPSSLGELPNRWSGVVELIDLMPTICDVQSLVPEKMPHGKSLLRQLRKGEGGDRVARSWTSMVAATQATVIGSRYKLIANTESGDARLYDLQADPGETQNIAETSQAMVAHLDAMLHTPDLPSVRMEKTELDEDTREKLRSLGYVD